MLSYALVVPMAQELHEPGSEVIPNYGRILLLDYFVLVYVVIRVLGRFRYRD